MLNKEARTGSMFETLFERSPDACLLIENNRFIACNEAAVVMLRANSKQQIFNTHPSDLSPPLQPDGRLSTEKADDMISMALRLGSLRFEWIHKRMDGEEFPVEVSLTTIRYHHRTFIYTLWRDISERKSLEEQLRQSQKMEAIGQLAGGVAHDFNNILMVIGGYVSMVEAELAPDDPKKEKLNQVLTATERAASLTRSLLTLSRKEVIKVRRINLNDVIHGIRNFLERVIGEDIHLDFAVKRDPLIVEADCGQIEQIFVNLATNARDAMPNGGNLIIETELQQVDALFINGHGFIVPGPYALTSVTDTGIGIDVETQGKIFEPFFTTKEVGKGTGLGLTIVYGVVRQHNGYINVYSEPGHGTTFRIYLPMAIVQGEERDAARVVAPPKGGNETILVAEDEPAVRKLIEAILTEYGYRVILARDGKDAVEIYRAHSNSVALVLMDVIMPVKSGVEAYKEIKEIKGAVKVLFLSGYTANFLINRWGIKNQAKLLMKPIQPEELLRKIREMLDL